MKEIAIKDTKEVIKIVKEIVTYDIPQSLKKLFRDIDPRKYQK